MTSRSAACPLRLQWLVMSLSPSRLSHLLSLCLSPHTSTQGLELAWSLPPDDRGRLADQLARAERPWLALAAVSDAETASRHARQFLAECWAHMLPSGRDGEGIFPALLDGVRELTSGALSREQADALAASLRSQDIDAVEEAYLGLLEQPDTQMPRVADLQLNENSTWRALEWLDIAPLTQDAVDAELQWARDTLRRHLDALKKSRNPTTAPQV